MQLFDALITSDERPDGDFANLAWFEVKRALLRASTSGPWITADDLLAHFEDLILFETERLARQGVQAHVALGVHPSAVPVRAHGELWQELPFLYQDPRVVALGPLSVLDHGDAAWRLVEKHLALLRDHQIALPVLFLLPHQMDTREKKQCIQTLQKLTLTYKIDADRVLVLGADWLTIDDVENAGFWSGLLRSPLRLGEKEAIRVVEHHNRRRILFGSGLSAGAADILALPKMAVKLTEAGIPSGDVKRLLYGNAMHFFFRAEASES